MIVDTICSGLLERLPEIVDSPKRAHRRLDWRLVLVNRSRLGLAALLHRARDDDAHSLLR